MPLAPTARSVSLSLGTGWNAPTALLGLELGVRMAPTWVLAATFGVAPRTTNPVYSLCLGGQCGRTEVEHHGPLAQRASLSVIKYWYRGRRTELGPFDQTEMGAGDVFVIETPGGGGFGAIEYGSKAKKQGQKQKHE